MARSERITIHLHRRIQNNSIWGSLECDCSFIVFQKAKQNQILLHWGCTWFINFSHSCRCAKVISFDLQLSLTCPVAEEFHPRFELAFSSVCFPVTLILPPAVLMAPHFLRQEMKRQSHLESWLIYVRVPELPDSQTSDSTVTCSVWTTGLFLVPWALANAWIMLMLW